MGTYIYIKTTQEIIIIFEFYVKNQYRQEQEFQLKICLSTNNHL
jgi:hypothetical protein